jgi:hypothetical protein
MFAEKWGKKFGSLLSLLCSAILYVSVNSGTKPVVQVTIEYDRDIIM